MSTVFKNFHHALRVGDGRALASCLAPVNSKDDATRLKSFAALSNFQTVEADIRFLVVQDSKAQKLSKLEAGQWIVVFVSFWKCVRELSLIETHRGGDWKAAFKAYKDVCVALCRGYTTAGFPAWTVPCLYISGKYLRMIAIKADAEASKNAAQGSGFQSGLTDDIADGQESNDNLQEAARTLQTMLSVCRTDEAELAESRKWGVIGLANLLFKTYFKLNNLSLTKHAIAMLESPGVNLPPLANFPMAQHCTYSYYRGVLEFLKENYSGAEKHLSEALGVCHKEATSNRDQILSYLIPAHILNNHQLPSDALLAQSPVLNQLFSPLCNAIKTGNLAAFDKALSDAEIELVNRRIYLTLERSRDLCMRNLFRKVYLNAGFETTKTADGQVTGKTRRTRLRIAEFEAGVKAAYKNAHEPVVIDRDEVECFLANMIYKGFMKGYIAREQAMVVLSKKKGEAFPNSGLEKLPEP